MNHIGDVIVKIRKNHWWDILSGPERRTYKRRKMPVKWTKIVRNTVKYFLSVDKYGQWCDDKIPVWHGSFSLLWHVRWCTFIHVVTWCNQCDTFMDVDTRILWDVMIKNMKLSRFDDGWKRHHMWSNVNVEDISFGWVFHFNRSITICGVVSHLPQKMKIVWRITLVSERRAPSMC
jgi:hypothetical protein